MNCIIGSGLVPSEEILLSARLQMRILSVPFSVSRLIPVRRR